ncbi:MAG: ParA family protein, partial [Chloroflexota bacterium]
NLTLANGFEPDDIQKNSSDILLDGLNIQEAIKKTNYQNLDLIPSLFRISEAEVLLPSRLNFGRILKNSLSKLSSEYDYVILDCPPSMGAITNNALNAADLLIIPTQAEYFSAYALRNMMNLVRQIRLDINPSLSYRILITMLDQRNKTHKTIREQLIQTFGTGVFTTVIEIDTRLKESPIFGIPINRYKPGSRGSLQYQNLAEEIIAFFDIRSR